MVKIALKLFICPFCPYTRGRACSTDPLGGKWHKAESLKGFLPHSAALQHRFGSSIPVSGSAQPWSWVGTPRSALLGLETTQQNDLSNCQNLQTW